MRDLKLTCCQCWTCWDINIYFSLGTYPLTLPKYISAATKWIHHLLLFTKYNQTTIKFPVHHKHTFHNQWTLLPYLQSFHIYSHSKVYHHRSHPAYWIYSTFFKPFTITSGAMPCHAMIINWQRSMTMGTLILPAGGRAWHPVMSQSLHCHLRYSLNGLFTTTSNICSCEKTPL